jgi:hypothetical protein
MEDALAPQDHGFLHEFSVERECASAGGPESCDNARRPSYIAGVWPKRLMDLAQSGSDEWRRGS